MMLPRVKELKKGIPVGTELPAQQRYGNIGRWVETELANNGYAVSNDKGVDMPDLGVEVKSRKKESNSNHTVGTMRIDEIIATDYPNSVIYEKFQQQYRVHYSDEGQVVTKEGIYDFSDNYIQRNVAEAYESGRKKIIENEENGYHPPYVKGTGWGHWEITDSCGSYRFRIPIIS